MGKFGKTFLVSLVTLSMVQFSSVGVLTTLNAEEDSIDVVSEGETITIGNEYIDREFSLENNKLSTTNIINERTGTTPTVFTPAAGSEEFIIKTTKEASEPVSLPAIDRTGWSATADSQNSAIPGASDGPGDNLIDGSLSTIWHTNYGNGTGDEQYPHSVLFTLNGEKTFQSLSYTPRQQGEAVNGNIKGYELWVANDDETLSADSQKWEKVASGDFKYNGVNPIYVNLDKATTANQVKFVATSSNNGERFAGGAEFNLHADKAPVVKDERTFKTSDLELNGSPVISDTSATINKVDKTGKKVTFNFKPYSFKGVEYTISQNIVMYEGDHFMRKYLEISVPNDQKDQAVIDYIDLESLNVNTSDTTWTIPTTAGGIVEMSQFKANLGQPIYIQGMFFGCEFPATDTQIVDGNGYMRYYTGKSFTQLGNDNQLTTDSDVAKYVTWQTVAGAARSVETEVVQADFFEYISSISTPSEFRIQYNSWFDNMMNIDDKNILDSFIEIDKELNNAEVRPLDSYVVDDGWNNYNNTSIVDADRSGKTLNESGFWEFNSKFPNGLTPSSELVEKFGSNFGVWVGPRGGYNFYGSIADILVKSGKGSKAGWSIDVADRNYVKNFTNMAVKWQEDYGVNYWKWDGFADNAQYNTWAATDGVPGYANNHMTGGYQQMYHVTDLWEAWIDLMETARANAEDNNINDLWISLTCYVNPSPWFLQWANSVWLQCTADQADAGSSSSKMDRQMTYRDACYYDFLKNHQFQFPQSNLYNHDPVYGKEGTGMNLNTATDEQFQNYLYMLSTRGTAFWELYYSDSIMTDGKYEVTGEFLEWAEENYHILKNSKMFGESPNTGTKLGGSTNGLQNAYGFSCFDGSDGIISLRNSSTEAKTITFTFDRTLGVPENVGTFNYHLEHTYNLTEGTASTGTLEYGQTYTYTLQPDEVRILNVSKNGDKTAPEINRVSSDGDKKITVKFNEKVMGTLFDVENAKIASISKHADDITYDITLTKALTDGQAVKVTAKDITDLAGNKVEKNEVTTTYHANNLVIQTKAEDITGSKEVGGASKTLDSNNGFTVSAKVKTTSTGLVATQKNGYDLGINDSGKAYFTLNGATATSTEVVNDGQEHIITGVKENNGILKLYVDGTLAGSKYKAANRYYSIQAGTTTIGHSGFDGNIALQVLDVAYGYDAVKELVSPSTERQPLASTNMTIEVSGTSEGEGDKINIFDNDPTTFWTSQEATAGIVQGNPYLQIDLGDTYTIDRFDYTKRFFNGTANMWKCTGNLRNYILEVSTDGETWSTVSSGATFDDEGYTEKGDGGTTEITFTPTEAKYVRISGTSSYHWQEANINKFMTVGDVKIFGDKTVATNLAEGKTASAKWTADNSSAANSIDRPISMVVDGTKDSTNNYGEFGSDNSSASSYLEVDLGKLSEVESLNLYRYWGDGRTYKGTVIALSDTADFANPTIVYNSDAENFHGFGEGSDKTYSESADGKTITLENKVNARYVRVYMHGSSGNTNHVVELEVMGYQKDTPVETVDMSGLIDRLAILSDVDTTKATTDSANAFNALVSEGYNLIATGATTQDEVDAMISKLENAETILVDTTALKAAIKEAEAKVKVSTISSSEALNVVIENAKALLVNGTDETIASALDAMENATKSLVARGNTSELADLIDSYKDLKESDYTSASWDGYKSALDVAKAIVADNSNSSQSDVENAKTALSDARKALVKAPVVVQVDKTKLGEAIKAAKDVDDEKYTTSSYRVVKDALAKAEEFNQATTVTQEQVNEATKTLNDAMKALVQRAEVAKGEEVLEKLDQEKLDESKYTAASWKAYVNARKALEKAVADNSDLTAEQLTALIAAVNTAKENLTVKPVEVDKTKLENLYTENKTRKNDNYTEASWKVFKNAITAANVIINNPEATQDQVDKAYQQLSDAIKGLTKKEVVVNGSETTTKPGNAINTGDALSIGGLVGMMLLSSAAIFVFVRKRKLANK